MLTNSGTITFRSMSFAMNTSAIDGILVDNNAGGTIAVNIIGCTFTGVTASVSQNKSLLQFEGGGASNVTANVQNTFFNSSRTYGLFAGAAGTSVMNVTVNQCGFGTDVNTGVPVNQPGTTITNPPAFSLGVTNSSSALVDYTITNNTFWGADGNLGAIYAVTISGASTTASAHLNGSFSFNKIGRTGVIGSGAANGSAGLGLLPGTQGQFYATVIGNDIRQVNTLGVNFFNSVTAGNTDATLKIKGNTFAEPDTTGAPLFLRAIVVSPGNSGGANNPWKAEIGDTTGTVPGNRNNISGAWQAGFFIRVTNNNNTSALTLPGLTPTSGATAAQVNTFVQNANTLPASSVGAALGTAGIIGGAPLPLLFAPGGVEAKVSGRVGVAPAVASVAPGTPERVNALHGSSTFDASRGTRDAAGGTPALPGIVRALTQAELNAVVSVALARWAATGLTGEQLATLRGLQFTVADLPGWHLGEAGGDRIRVDRNAGGHGWFIGAGPESDALFSGSGDIPVADETTAPEAHTFTATRLAVRASNPAALPQKMGRSAAAATAAATATGMSPLPARRYTYPASPAAGRIDLLTTILHEMGHALGLDDTYAGPDRDSLMYGFLTKGERRLPAKNQAAGAVPRADGVTHFLGTPLTIGDLPAGKSVTITYVVTITGAPANITNQGTVSGGNFATVLTDDPTVAGGPNPTVTPVELPPIVSNVSKSTNEDITLGFAAADFTPGSYSDANGDALTTVRITSLPANGVLKLSGVNVTLNQDIPIANIGNLTYASNLDYNGADSFGWNGSDGTLFAVSGATVNVTIIPVNDAPVLAAIEGAALAYLENQAATAITATLTVSDVDSANLAGATVSITANYGNGQDVLAFTNQFNITGSFSTAGGVLTLNGADTLAHYQTALRAVTYQNTSDNPGTLARTVAFRVDDAGAVNNLSNIVTRTINVTAVNDAPTLDVIPNPAAIPRNAPTQTVNLSGITAGGGEVQTLTVTASSGNTAVIPNPTVTYTSPNATGSLSYTPVAGQLGSAVITVTVTDSGGIANGGINTTFRTFTVTVANRNPVANPDTIERYATQNTKVLVATLLANDTDPDGDTPLSITGVGAAASGQATVTMSGGYVFYQPNAGFLAGDTFTYTLSDGQGGTASGTVTVTIHTDNAPSQNVTKIDMQPDGAHVSFAGIPGRTYRVQTTDSLAPATWVDRAFVPADALGKIPFLDPIPLPPTRFYRTIFP